MSVCPSVRPSVRSRVADPAERRTFVEAVRLVDDVTDVAAHAVVQHPLEQLHAIDVIPLPFHDR